MKTISKLRILTAAAALTFSAQALTITPSSQQQWSGSTPKNPAAADVSTKVGVPGLVEVYKQDVGEPETPGGFAASYDTTFSNSATDPEDALIEYVSGPSINTASPTFLLVKDGVKHDPIWYIFNLSNIETSAGSGVFTAWNGTDDLILDGFWPGNGAISHIAIYQGSSTNVPDGGATAALLGLGFLGLAAFARRRA